MDTTFILAFLGVGRLRGFLLVDFSFLSKNEWLMEEVIFPNQLNLLSPLQLRNKQVSFNLSFIQEVLVRKNKIYIQHCIF